MFKALYRKYRPTTFNDVVGQHHAVTVLQKAIEKNKIAHAYIFYGPRGTGKTSIAKIFASEVNNQEYKNDSVDIIEIDAASNNGVDEIREIKEAIKFAPTESKYKVYIIDEVHMLTTSAFNALLKTLEEPPSHIIFILATTEIHKVPATILSRCQKFEFKNLKNDQLESRLKFIADKEKIEITDEAIKKIAILAKGGLRDAIGLLDQASNYGISKITLNDILDITSSLSDENIIEFYKLILEQNANAALIKYNEFINTGKDSKIILSNLISLSRDLIILKNMDSKDFCEFNVSIIEDNIKNVSSEQIYRNIEILSQIEQNIRYSQEQISYMQIGIIKMCSDIENNSESTKIANYTIDNSILKKLENKIALLEEKLTNIADNSKDNNYYNSEHEDISLSKDATLIIPQKNEILTVLNEENEKFTKYINNVYDFILNSVIKVNDSAYSIFSDTNIIASSKYAGVLLFNTAENLTKAKANPKYKAYIENYISKKIDVEYKIYYLQRSQYKQILKNMDKENNTYENFEKNSKEKKISKIESLFSDIIVESADIVE